MDKQIIRAAACQILTYGSVQKSTDKIIDWIIKAKANNIELIVFPEAALCGYQTALDYWDAADPFEFEKQIYRVVTASKDLCISVVVGTPRWEDDKLYNSLLVIDKGIIRGYYDKTHLAEDWPSPGHRLPIYQIAGVDACFIICHDIRYPELVRLPAVKGAQLCIFSSNESPLIREDKLSAYRAMPIARAAENEIYVIMANAPADPNDMTSDSQSHGNSKIIDPFGNIILEAGYFEETLVIADIDISKAKRTYAKRAQNDVSILSEWLKTGVSKVVTDS